MMVKWKGRSAVKNSQIGAHLATIIVSKIRTQNLNFMEIPFLIQIKR